MNANLAQDGTSRRDLLKLGALAGGGLLLGIGLGGCSKPAALGGAGGQPVAWLRIGGDDAGFGDEDGEGFHGITP